MNKYILFLGLIASIILNGIYIFKKRQSAKKNKTLLNMLNVNVFGYLVSIAALLIEKSDRTFLLATIITRFYLLYLLVFLLLFTYHLYGILYKEVDKKHRNKWKNISFIAFYFLAIISIFMPIVFSGTKVFGEAIDFIYLCHVGCMFWWLVMIIKKPAIDMKRYAPVASFIVLLSLALIFQKQNMAVYMITVIHTIVLFLIAYNCDKEGELPQVQEEETRELMSYNAKEVFENICEHFKSSNNEKTENVSFEYWDIIPDHLEGDGETIEQICINMIKSSLELSKDDSSKVSVDVINKGDFCKLIIIITSNGESLKKEELDEIFKEDCSTLGKLSRLSDAKRMVNALNGKFIVQSDRKNGNKFILAFEQKII